MARRIDAATAAAIERAEWESLGPDQACGFLAIAGLLAETSRRRLAPQRLALCNSGDTAGGPDPARRYRAPMVEEKASAPWPAPRPPRAPPAPTPPPPLLPPPPQH